MEVVNGLRMTRLNLLEYIHTLEDNRFDLVYPPAIRALSSAHWTPVIVARRAVEVLVRKPGTRVLDIGCGPGKFCIVGALLTEGRFTGVEQRQHFCRVARSVIGGANLANADIIHGNVTDIVFSNFDAFYLFNPFQENLGDWAIDKTVQLSSDLYGKYTDYVAQQLALAPLGTRVVTYCGACDEVPLGYECIESSLDHGLKFWEKVKTHAIRANPPATKNKRRFSSDRMAQGGPADGFF